MTTNDSLQSQPQSVNYTIALDSLIRILAACGMKPAGSIGLPDRFYHSCIWRNIPLIETDTTEYQRFHTNTAACTHICSTMTCTACCVSTAILPGIRIQSIFCLSRGIYKRTDSLIKRRNRFLYTARLSNDDGTIIAQRNISVSFGYIMQRRCSV